MRVGKYLISRISMGSPSLGGTLLGAAILTTLFLTGVGGFAQTAANPDHYGVAPPHQRYGEFPRFKSYRFGDDDSTNRFNQRRVKPFKLVGNLYYVGFQDVPSLLIVTPQGHILIDTTWEETFPMIMESIEELGFQVRDIKYLLSSHGHIAHISAQATAKQLTGAQIWASRLDGATIEDGGLKEEGMVRWKAAKVDKFVQDGDKLTLGGTTLAAHLTPCETKGATTWTMVAEENGKRYNIVMSPGLSAGANSAEWPTRARDCEVALTKSLELPVDIWTSVHSPHSGFHEKYAKIRAMSSTNPFIDPQGFRSYALGEQKKLQEILAKEQAGGGQRR